MGDVEMAKSRREELMRKLEGMGYDVGYRFAERCVLEALGWEDSGLIPCFGGG